MIPSATRLDIINNKFAYTSDETVTINAAQLCAEIIAHDKLKYKVAFLEDRIKLLTSLIQIPSTTYRHIDLIG